MATYKLMINSKNQAMMRVDNERNSCIGELVHIIRVLTNLL